MFTPELIAETIALSAVVLAVTQAIKKWVHTEGSVAFIISGIVTVIVVLLKTLSVEPQEWAKFIILVIAVFLEANGFYHFGAYAIGKMSKVKDTKDN